MTGVPSGKTLKLISSDNKEFVVDLRVAFMSEYIKRLYELKPEETTEIPVPDVNGDILQRVITFCNTRTFGVTI